MPTYYFVYLIVSVAFMLTGYHWTGFCIIAVIGWLASAVEEIKSNKLKSIQDDNSK